MGQRAVNPQTGETVEWNGSAWAPVPAAQPAPGPRIAVNPQTGQKVAWSGSAWEPYDADKAMVDNLGTGERLLRDANLYARGITDVGAELAGAPVDLVTGAVNKLANPINPGSIDKAKATIAGLPGGRFADLLKQAAQATETPQPRGPLIDPNTVPGGSQSIKNVVAGVGEIANEPFKAVAGEIPQGPFRDVNRRDKIVSTAGRYTGGVLSTLGPATVVANAAKTGGLTQGIARQLAAQPGMQITSGIVGGVAEGATDSPVAGLVAALATPLAAEAGKRLISPFANAPNVANQEMRRLVEAMEKAGVKLNPAQKTGSKVLKSIDAAMENMPVSGGMISGEKGRQLAAWQKAVLKRAGIDADNVGEEVLRAAKDAFTAKYDEAVKGLTVGLDDDWAKAVKAAWDNLDNNLPHGKTPRDVLPKSFVTALEQFRDGKVASISGEMAQATRRQFSTLAKGNGPEVQAMRVLRDAYDDAIQRAMDEAGRGGVWKDLNRQYSVFKDISKAANTTEAKGTISPAKLDSVVRARGGGDLADLAKGGAALLKPMQDSGTAQRSFYQNVMTGSPFVGLGAGVATGNPLLAAASIGGPAVAYGALHNPVTKAYLTNQLMGGVKPAMTRELVQAQLLARALQEINKPPAIAPR